MKNSFFYIVAFFLISRQIGWAEFEGSWEFEKGYLFAKLEDRFPNEDIQFDIQDDKLIIYLYPDDPELCEEVKAYIESLQGYEVVFDRSYEQKDSSHLHDFTIASYDRIREEGDWLPELSPFFPTMLASPRIIGYSMGYRTHDRPFKTGCLPVSIGDQFSLYQFKTQTRGQLYVGIEACVWAIFEARATSLSLINADYYVAVPLTYINNRFSARLRLFHESSHLGDEFLLENANILRVNPSMEGLDLSLAYDFTSKFTLFAGATRIIRSDESYKMQPYGVYYGFNYIPDFFKIKVCNLEATPYIATYFCNSQDHKWSLDSFAAIGYQWDKLYGHKLRIFMEGHRGYSCEGQFSRQKTQYLAFKILYGY